jgi:hypothetical protein
VFNMSTLQAARRRGLGTALTPVTSTPRPSAAARPPPCTTSMGERVYAAVGFRDLGLILEYVPS